MKYVVIGLGNFGTILAKELTALGHEVIGADMNSRRVEYIKDSIAAAFVLDAGEKDAMDILPVNEVDVVIVAIGENFGASVKSVALLKQSGVKEIHARAIDEVHLAVLESLQVNKILTPEADSAKQLAHTMEFEYMIDSFPIDDSHYVSKFRVPKGYIGSSIKDIGLEESFNMKVIALKRKKETTNFIGTKTNKEEVVQEFNQDTIIQDGDEIVAYGLFSDFRKLLR